MITNRIRVLIIYIITYKNMWHLHPLNLFVLVQIENFPNFNWWNYNLAIFLLLNISRECFKKLIKLKSLKLVHIIVGIAGEENQWQRVLKQYMFISHLWSLRHKAMNITFDICYLLIYVRGITLWKVKLEKGWNFYMVFLLYEF